MDYQSNFDVQDLGGRWDRELSSPVGPILKLQGVPWVIRKGIDLATLYLDISVYAKLCPQTSKSTMNIDVLQTATGGLAGTTEKRELNWTAQAHTDYIFGNVNGWSRLIHGSQDNDQNIRPDIQMQTETDNQRIADFLKAKILPDGTKSGKFLVEGQSAPNTQNGRGNWVHTFARNKESGWTAEQVWGFEMIHQKYYHTRRIVVANARGDYQLARLVYARQGCEK